MSEYFGFCLSHSHCGFSSELCLVWMLEKWISATDNGRSFRALFTYLPRALDCSLYDVLISKWSVYGFDMSALRFLHSNLTNCMQKKKKKLITVFGKKLRVGFHVDLYWGLYYWTYYPSLCLKVFLGLAH